MHKRDAAWGYFTSNDNISYACTLCGSRLSIKPSTVCNLKRHLLRRHAEVDWNSVYRNSMTDESSSLQRRRRESTASAVDEEPTLKVSLYTLCEVKECTDDKV